MLARRFHGLPAIRRSWLWCAAWLCLGLMAPSASAQLSSGEFNFSQRIYVAAEGEFAAPGRSVQGALITVTRSAPAFGRVAVDFTTINTNTTPCPNTNDTLAVPDCDFTPVSGTLFFDHLEMSKKFVVGVMSDGEVSDTKEVFLRLSNPRIDDVEILFSPNLNAPTLGADDEASIFILEYVEAQNQGTNFVLARTSYIVDEGTNNTTTVDVDVLLPSASGGRVRIVAGGSEWRGTPRAYFPKTGSDYVNSVASIFQPQPDFTDGTPPVFDPQDFTAFSQDLTFGAGQFRQTVTITITNDPAVEFNEDISVQLEWLGGNEPPVGQVSSALITILFDDQPAGALDREWNPDFVNTTLPRYNLTPGANNIVRALVVQPDQKSIIGGDFTAYNSFPRNRIARINADGSNDDTFDPGSGADDFVSAVAVHANQGPALDGKIVVVGGFTSMNNLQRNGVARLNANGSLDNSFSVGAGANGVVRSVALQSDGKVVIAGDFTQFNGATRNGVARLNTDGSLDATFNPGGGPDGVVWAVAVSETPSRKIYLGGEFMEFSGVFCGNVGRLNDDGSVDTTFDAGGGADGPVYALASMPDGRLILGGAFVTVDFTSNPTVARLLTTGRLDESFNAGSGADGAVYALALQSDGKVLAGGTFTSFNGTRRLGVTRLFVNGTVDTSFMDTGYNQFAGLINDYAFVTPNYVNALGVQPDGAVMIGGSFYQVGGNFAHEYYDFDGRLSKPAYETDGTGNTTSWAWTRADKRTRYNVARLIGGHTPGPGNLSFGFPQNTIDEGAGIIYVEINRLDGGLGAIAADYLSSDNVALAGQDYTAINYQVDWDADFGSGAPRHVGETDSLDAGVFITRDNLIEGDESFFLSLANPAGSINLSGEIIPVGTALGRHATSVSISDDDFSKGILAFQRAEYATNEGPASLRVTVVRTNGSDGLVSVRYFTHSAGGAIASPGSDYTPVSGILTFGSGVTNLTLTVPILNDFSVEPDEDFYIVLTNALGGAVIAGGQPSPPGSFTNSLTARAVIIDNDLQSGRANFSSATYSAGEGSGSAEITLVRLGGSVGQLSVSVGATNGSAQGGIDFTSTTNTITWVDGDVAPKTFSVTLLDDSAVEPNETIGLRIFDAFPANAIGGVSNATLTVVEDDLYGSLSFSQAFFDADERGTNVTIIVTRSGGVGGTVSVNYAATAGPSATASDFVPTSGTLTFGPGITATNFEVTILNNGLQDGERIATLTLSGFVNATPGATPSSQLRIIDDESFGDPAGSLDTTFSALAGGTNAIHALALQPDGRLLLGGEFRTLNRALRNRIGRLHPDGSLDTSFNPLSGPNAAVRAVALQPDGRVVIGGFFDMVRGTNRNHIARLLPDGTLDGFFNPGAGADNPVYALAIHPDGRIVMGGSFTTVNGIPRAGVALLEANGVVSAAFAPGTAADGTVFAVAIQADGKILIGGDFTTFDGLPQPRIARLNVDGSVDATFDAGTGPSGAVRAIALQPDGKILIGGSFTNVNGTPRGKLARLDSSGALDTAFMSAVEGGNLDVASISIQFDGKIIVAGEFTTFNGVSRNRITRLYRNGKTDPTINFGDGANDIINASVIQEDRKIVIGGRFTAYDGEPRSFLARIHGGSIAGAGSFRFSAPYFDVTENAGQAVISVQRRGGLTSDVTVDYQTQDISATAGADYTTSSGTLNFLEGETRQTFTVPILNDFVGEPSETVLLVLTNATSGATLGTIPNATLTILNDDSGVGFSSAAYTINEGVVGGTVLISVVRTGATNGTATVDYTTASGTATAGQDFSTRSGTLTFAPGVTLQTFNVPIAEDQLIEPSEMFNIQLSNLTGGGALSVPTAVVTIVDNDFQTGDLTFAAPAYSVAESGGNVSVTVLRTNGSTGVITVDYATVAATALAGNDYTSQSGTLIFVEGQTSQSIVVPILDDASVEGDEVFAVQIFNPGGGTIISGPTNVFVTIVDEETGPGSLDRTFDPGLGANDLVRSVAVQTDGKLVVGGAFTLFNGTNHNYLARLLADGAVDASFNPGTGPNGIVVSISSMADGRAVIGGGFTLVDGTPYKFISRLLAGGAADSNISRDAGFNGSVHVVRARPDGRMLVGGSFGLPTRGFVQLRLDGSVDTAFSPGVGTDGPVHAFVVQSDGRVLLAGAFNTVDGLPRSRVARVYADGSLDGSFTPTAITNGTVYTMVLQSSGQVVVAGDFQTVAGTNWVRIARLNIDGSLDGSFNVGSGANDVVFAMGANVADQILLGGSFTAINGTNRNRIARLNADGGLDLSFDPGPGANGTVYSLAMIPSGDFIIGGDFTVVSGTPRNRLARILGGGVAPLPLLLQSASAAGGQFQMVMSSRPGQRFVLEASPDLRTWQPVQTNIATGATTTFVQPNMGGYPARFFRVRQQGP
jgi:uncharacterized delta-60 repeat protein